MRKPQSGIYPNEFFGLVSPTAQYSYVLRLPPQMHTIELPLSCRLNIDSIICLSAVAVGAAVLRSLYRQGREPVDQAWIRSFAIQNYRPMLTILSDADFEFLQESAWLPAGDWCKTLEGPPQEFPQVPWRTSSGITTGCIRPLAHWCARHPATAPTSPSRSSKVTCCLPGESCSSN